MTRARAAASITVVIACHDAAGTIEAAVRSALSDPAVDQCVVVDDASSDRSSDRVHALGEVDPRVEPVSRASRGGPAAARNDGLAVARGPLVCFLDADDVLLDGGVSALRAALEHTGVVAALGAFHAVDDHGAPVDVGSWAKDQLHPVVRRGGRLIDSPEGMTPEALVTRLVSPPPGAWLVDRRAALAVGGFDPRVRRSEDLEFLVRLADAGHVACVDRVVLSYRRHEAQRSASHARRRWGRGAALWSMLRAAPGAAATRQLAHGMAAYHLELFASRRRAGSLKVRAMGLRNLVVAGVLHAEGVVASALPRRVPPPLAGVDAGAVD